MARWWKPKISGTSLIVRIICNSVFSLLLRLYLHSAPYFIYSTNENKKVIRWFAHARFKSLFEICLLSLLHNWTITADCMTKSREKMWNCPPPTWRKLKFLKIDERGVKRFVESAKIFLVNIIIILGSPREDSDYSPLRQNFIKHTWWEAICYPYSYLLEILYAEIIKSVRFFKRVI